MASGAVLRGRGGRLRVRRRLCSPQPRRRWLSATSAADTFDAGDGVRLSYRDAGPKSAPACLFLAGVGSRMDTFAKHVDDLSSDLRCITLDNRGTGGSDAPVAACTIDDMARDALALVAEVGLSDVHVVGQSMGGMIAQRMAVLEPDAVRSLTLCSTVAWIDGRTRAYWGSLPTLAATLSPTDFLKALTPWMAGRATLDDPDSPMLAMIEQAAAHPQPTPPHTWEQQVDAMLAFDSRPSLAEIGQPTLVTVGSDDIGTPPYQSEYLAEHIDGARLHVFEGAGHRAINERHDEFCALLKDWVQQQDRPRAVATPVSGRRGGEFTTGFVGLGNMGGACVSLPYLAAFCPLPDPLTEPGGVGALAAAAADRARSRLRPPPTGIRRPLRRADACRARAAAARKLRQGCRGAV